MTASAPPLEPPTTSRVAPHVACEHCSLPVPAALVEPGDDHQFCCGGCRLAYATIHQSGLAEYYRVRERSPQRSGGRQGRRADAAADRYASYDSGEFLARHGKRTAAGACVVELRLEGVHCAACVWLVERLPRVAPGVLDARLSLQGSTARVAWDPQQTSLSAIAQRLASLGYAPHPARGASGRAERATAERTQLVAMAVAGACAGNNMLIAVALYAGLFHGIEPQFATMFRWLSMAIGLLSLAWPGGVFFRGAWAAIRTRSANLDLPIAAALAVGGVAGTANVLLDRGDIYFDSLSVLVFLLLAGRFVQSRQQRWAEDAVGLMLSLTPVNCRVVRGDALVSEPVEALGVGDVVEVRSGELFPADGAVVEGESSVDVALLSGESLPQPVGVGGGVYAGSQNVGATLRVQVAAVGDATRAGKLMRLVEEGTRSKPPIVERADRLAQWFIVVVGAIAVANFGAWCVTRGAAPAIDSTVALLVVACPCALGLATPLTMAVAIGRAAQQGVLVKDAAVLERLGAVSPARPGVMLLDKTGTLTYGRPRVVEWIGDQRVAGVVAAAERESNHPLGRGLAEHADGDAVQVLERCERLDGGVIASFRDRRDEAAAQGPAQGPTQGTVAIGSPSFALKVGMQVSASLLEAVHNAGAEQATAVVVGVAPESGATEGFRAVAVAWLRDEPLDDAASSIARLERLGWRAEILSGDQQGPVEGVAARVGIPTERARHGVTPEGKLERVRELGGATVVMVGDGVNDAAALAAADVGIAVHGGAEASLAAADLYVARPGVEAVVDLVRLARRTLRVARGNLVVSLCYNALAVGLAAAGYITPLVAAVLMPISSASVLAAAIGGFSVRPTKE